jgi:hypothetical protein
LIFVVRKGKMIRRILAKYGENCSTDRKVYHGTEFPEWQHKWW